MINEERIETFINSFGEDLPEYLADLREYAIKTDVPIIRPQMQSFIKLLFTMKKPESILEVGTAIGFSALLMREYTNAQCNIDTIEKYEPRIVEAKENFKKYDPDKKISLYEGDAAEVLKELSGEYDFIFMDAAKGQYIHFLPEIKRLLKKGGVLLSDNVLQDGNVMESRFAVVRRDRTIHGRMREYLYALKNDPEFVTDILALGDGVTVSVKC